MPGPRSYALLSPVQFPWRDAVDVIEEVSSVDSYTLSMKLSREGLICGPSSGFNLQGRVLYRLEVAIVLIRAGLYQLLERYKSAGTLDEMRNDDGLIHCAFLCCDLPYQYVSEYFTKVDGNNFHPIRNQVRNATYSSGHCPPPSSPGLALTFFPESGYGRPLSI